MALWDFGVTTGIFFFRIDQKWLKIKRKNNLQSKTKAFEPFRIPKNVRTLGLSA